MDSRQYTITREIAALEAALEGERRSLLCVGWGQRRQELRLNLAAGYEALGALYRRLHGLGETIEVTEDALIDIVGAVLPRPPLPWEAS